MGTKQIRLIIDSDFKNTVLVGQATSHLCTLMSVTKKDVDKIELCVIEAVNNSIEHAYKKQSGHDVEVLITFFRDKIEIKVCDTGISMDLLCLENSDITFPEPNLMDLADIPEHGRGLLLIKTFMDTVSYKSKHSKNYLVMTKHIKTHYRRDK